MRKEKLDKVFEIIKSASRNRNLVELVYLKDKEEKVYIVEPYELDFKKEIFYGFKVGEGIRKFKFDKLVRAREIEERFLPRWEVKIG